MTLNTYSREMTSIHTVLGLSIGGGASLDECFAISFLGEVWLYDKSAMCTDIPEPCIDSVNFSPRLRFAKTGNNTF